MKVLLQCGHETTGQTLAEWFSCSHCGVDVKPQAFECREWKIGCSGCRYARWFGQDKTAAEIGATAHQNKSGHHMHIDYLIHPVTKERVRLIHGRRVRLRIDDIPVGNRWPAVRSVQPPLPVDNDIPPF
jgi:hypothetical protein